MAMSSAGDAFALSVLLLAFLNVATGIELLALLRSRAWGVLSGDSLPRSSPRHRVEDRWRGAAPALTALVLIIGGGSLPILKAASGAFAIAAFMSLISNVLVFFVMRFGLEGADHVRLYVSAFCAIAALVSLVEPEQGYRLYCILVTSLCVAFYFGAALVKIVEVEWWTGSAVRIALSTRQFGNASMCRILCRHPAIARMASVLVICLEISFPFVIFVFPDHVVSWIVVGLAFHVIASVSMRLPLFLPAVGTMYPAVLWTSGTITSAWANLRVLWF